ncbi:MAG: hypothetical protein M0R22_08580 [Dehalococcoidia bacterium]|jgi:hypothetical protein|nr:hypothetical protein [Dehalococcoidia bacterium]
MGVLQRQIKAKLFDKYNADTSGFKTAINGFYFYKAPDGITQDNYPIVLYSIITTSSELTFSGGAVPSTETPLIEFKILSKNVISTEAEDILEKLQAVFDGASLTLSGWRVRELRRELRNSITGPYVDEFGIWNINALYRAVCDKS